MRLKKIEAMAEPRIPPDRAGEVEARRRFRLRVLGVVSLLVLAVVVVWWWKGRFVSTTGRVVAYEVLVNATERGRIVSLPVTEGERVRADEVVARLDPKERQAELKRAEAVLQQTRSHLAALDETGLDPNAFAQVEISKREHLQARERLSRAQAELEQAQKELARLRRSAERVDRVFLLKAVTRAEWEAAREDLDKAETHHASARTRVAEEEAALQAPERLLERAREALAFARRELADELEARRMAIVQAEGQVEAARAGLAETSIRAPRDGVVSWLPRRVGEVVDQNDVILSLMDPDEVWIEAYVSGEELSQLRDGLPAKIHFSGPSREIFDGRLLLLHASSRADQQTVRVGPERARSAARLGALLHAVKVVFEGEAPQGLWPETIVQVRISKR